VIFISKFTLEYCDARVFQITIFYLVVPEAYAPEQLMTSCNVLIVYFDATFTVVTCTTSEHFIISHTTLVVGEKIYRGVPGSGGAQF